MGEGRDGFLEHVVVDLIYGTAGRSSERLEGVGGGGVGRPPDTT